MPLDPERKVPPWALAIAALIAGYLLLWVFEGAMDKLAAVEAAHAVDQAHDRSKRAELDDDQHSIHSELEEERVAAARHRGMMEERTRWLMKGHHDREQ